MRIRLNIEYDGTKFCGWQKQNTAISVQETIEKAICKIFNREERVEIYGAGRTDTGVHAICQVAHFEILESDLIGKWENNCQKLIRGINSYIRDSGAVITNASVVPDDFHARFSAKMRNYRYLIYNKSVDSVLHKNRVWHVIQELDVDLMNNSAQDFIGTHDFNAFRSSECCAKNSIRTISSIKLYKKDDLVIMDLSAKSFLHNQVRITIGTLKNIGIGKLSPSYIQFLLESRDRTLAGPTAPPYGLYLKSVEY